MLDALIDVVAVSCTVAESQRIPRLDASFWIVIVRTIISDAMIFGILLALCFIQGTLCRATGSFYKIVTNNAPLFGVFFFGNVVRFAVAGTRRLSRGNQFGLVHRVEIIVVLVTYDVCAEAIVVALLQCVSLVFPKALVVHHDRCIFLRKARRLASTGRIVFHTGDAWGALGFSVYNDRHFAVGTGRVYSWLTDFQGHHGPLAGRWVGPNNVLILNTIR